MKTYIKILIGLIYLTAFNACDSWLDVQPKTEIKSEKVFEKSEYFKQTLIGVYLELSDQSLYGKELTCCYLDAVAGIYDFRNTNAIYYQASKRDFTKSININTTSNIWISSYNAIANINNILQNIKTQKCLDSITARYIEGEARGLRAFIHLDLLRMFGPGNLANNKSGMTKIAIPYVTKYSKVLSPQLKTSEVLDKIHKDLDLSIDLLNLELPNKYKTDLFFTKDRNLRFNYNAALAIQARAYLWEGNYEESLKYSEKLIKENEDKKVDFVKESDILNNRDYIFSSEIIFGLNIYNFYENSDIMTNFEDFRNIGAGENDELMFINGDRFEKIYETKDIGQSDFRQNYQFTNKDLDKLLFKYNENNGSHSKNKVAIIRLPEVYYIAAESLYKLDIRKEDALNYLNLVRKSRTLTTDIINEDDFEKEIMKEYYKDLIGDGQIFYFIKRLGYNIMPYTGAVINTNSLVFPIPQDEINFGRK